MIFFYYFRAVHNVNGAELEGSTLKVELAVDKKPTKRGPARGGPGAFGGLPGQGRQTDFPLRILVQSDMVSNPPHPKPGVHPYVNDQIYRYQRSNSKIKTIAICPVQNRLYFRTVSSCDTFIKIISKASF